MKNKIVLIILQYNVRNERMRTMIFLLIDDNMQNFNVIVIQELWRNFIVSITLNFNQSDFHLLYRFDEDTKICFYVNDKLNTNSWDVEYFTIDICTLKMKINDLNEDSSMIHIHNVYNFSLIFYSSRNSSFTFSKTKRFLVDALTNHYILLEDFNLHHFFWNDSSRSTQHVAANELLNIIEKHDLTLTLFKKFITWKNRITASIIDLTFMTTHLIDKLKHCTTRSDLNQSRITYRSRLAYSAKSSRTHFESFEKRKNRSIWKRWKKLKRTRRLCHVRHRLARSMSMCVKFRNFCNRWWRRSYFERYSIDTLNSFESKNVMMQSKTFVDSNVVDHSFRI
jgi:hypothetical protein